MHIASPKTFALAGALLLAAAQFTSVPATAAGKIDLNFGAGTQGGSQYPVTVAIGQIIQKLPELGSVTLQPGTSIGNIVRVQTGKSHIGISLSSSLTGGRAGMKPFKSKTDKVVNLITLHAFSVIVIVPQDSPIKSFTDFAGKKLNIAPKGYSVREVGEALLDMVGIKGKVTIGSLRITEAVEGLKDGHFDGLLYSASERMAPFLNLAETRDIRQIQIDRKVLEAYAKKDPSYYLTTWPKNRSVYKRLSNSATTLAYPNVIVASAELPDNVAYAIVKRVAENFDPVRQVEKSLVEFDVKNMAIAVGAPFHPGAVKYYKERGWMK
jgi:hypothetical protein